MEADEELLRSVLELLGHRPRSYRRVRAAPRARLRRRVAELGLADPDYLARLARDPAERALAERLVTVTLSRFFRDRELWEFLGRSVLPLLARQRREPRLWSAGTASGEEAYSLAIAWLQAAGEPARPVRIIATDVRADCLDRGRAAAYGRSSLRDVPRPVREERFRAVGEQWILADAVRAMVHLARHDLARDPWPRELDLLMMRNNVFSYWAEERQDRALAACEVSLQSHAWLVIGAREELPAAAAERFVRCHPRLPVFRRRH